MKHILSIQSHVAYGFVGNRSAVFPLQIIGHNVSPINTVQFSNHTGHGKWTGQIFSRDHILDVYRGVCDLALEPIDALISGYIGSQEIGEAILDIVKKEREKNKDFFFSMDPVLGDVGRNFFVADSVCKFFKEKAIEEADLACPNHFEFNYLVGREVKTICEAKDAILELKTRCRFTKLVITSFIASDFDGISCLLYDDGEFYTLKTPRIDFKKALNGSGDMLSALMCGHLLNGHSAKLSLEKTINSVYEVMLNTHKKNKRELDMIESQNCFKEPKKMFTAIKV